MSALTPGLRTRVRVPASTANLGPGFDCLGLALGLYDEVSVAVTGSGVTVAASGEGSDAVPLDERHLVARAVLRGLEVAGVSAPGLHLDCTNVIPHSRGLGSSASAVVGGLAAASGLLGAAGLTPLTDVQLVQLAGEFEGHPDNAAASVLGGAVVTWSNDEGGYFARHLDLHPSITATVFVPDRESSTHETRGLLPDSIPRGDAVFNISRVALGVVALTADPSCLLPATEDKLHQGYRAPAMPETAALVADLRKLGHAATVSGAGPSVIVLGTQALGEQEAALASEHGFAVRPLAVGGRVEVHY